MSNIDRRLDEITKTIKKSNNTGRNSGLSFSVLLFIAFLVLKLCKVITWPWIWVFAPLWIPPVMVLVFLVFVLLILIVAAIFDN